MAIIVNWEGASLVKAGSYSVTKVADGGAAQPQLGVLALVGEANEGPAYSSSDIEASAFGPDEFSRIEAVFGSGELVDMAKLALSPSGTEEIKGGAQKLYLMKTNSGTKASLALPTSYGSIAYKKAGVPGNGVTAQVAVTGPTVVITIARPSTGVSEVSSPLGNNVAMTISCTDGVASAATLTIAAGVLTTAITGGSASPLNIKLSNFTTIGQLVEYINSMPNYVATVGAAEGAVNMPTSVLDSQSAVNILSVVASIKRDLQDVKDFFATSGLVDFTATATSGLPTTLAKTFLSGGAKGATSAAAMTSAIDTLAKARINFIVPLISRDATADIAAGLTEAASTYTIAGAAAALRSHVAQMATIKGKKERQGFVGINDTYVNQKKFASDYSHARMQYCMDMVSVATPFDGVQKKQPHAEAVISAAMKCAAAVGLSNTYKAPNISGFSAPAGDFDPETQGEDALKANLTFVEKNPGGGFRFALDNSSYALQKEAWVWARPAVIYASDTAALTIRLTTEAGVGKRNSDLGKPQVEQIVISALDSLRSAGIIVADKKSGGKGWKDLSVRIEGSIIYIDVTLILVENFEFILSGIKLDRAQF